MVNKALGRGLGALLPPKEALIATDDTKSDSKSGVSHIPVSKIKGNKYQPRVEFNQEKLNDLVKSITEKGVVQPVLVRRKGDEYELIAGERRLRAVTMLGLEKIPAIIRDATDIDMLEISLIENIQREELNSMEEAHAYQKFLTDFHYTQDKIAKVLGKDRSTIANTLRLLTLPKKIQDFISKNSITQGHAKAILALHTENEQVRVSNLVVKKGLSVRETEKLVSRRLSGASGEKTALKKDPHVSDIETYLQQALGTRVKISHGKKRGVIHVEYYSLEDLDRIIKIISPKS